ncbi:MAG: YceI family protein [Candidatus Dormibacteria bacterium]
MSRLKLAVAVAVAVAVVALGGGAYLLTRPHAGPPPVALSAGPGPSSGSAGAQLAGTWLVDAGSEVGYRVRERFVGQPADTEAVARTSTISGRLALAGDGDGTRLQSASFSADIGKLNSQDPNATHGLAVRDVFVGRIYLETAVYPMATFVARPLPVTSSATTSSLMVGGAFTVHGVTHDVAIPLQVSRNDERLEVVGAFPLHYPDYKIDVPQVPFTSANPDATIEVHLFLKRG